MSVYDEVSIEKVSSEDLPQILNLWNLSFAPPYDIQSFDDYVTQHLSLLLAAQHNGKVAAVLGIINFEIMLAGNPSPCAGIAAVATHPSYRRQGLTRKLLQAALSQLYEQRVPLAALWPFSYQFYEHFGWSTTDLQFQVELSSASLPKVGTALGYDEISVQDCESLFDLHDAWCRRWNLSLRRSRLRWQRMLSKPDATWLLLRHKEGYMLANLKEAQAGTLILREWCYLSEAGFHDGIALLRQMDSQFARVRWLSGEIESLLRLGVPNEAPSIMVLPGMMTRVVHPQAFEELLPVKLHGIKIVDPLRVSSIDGAGQEVGPGELVQIVSGFFQNIQYPESLARIHKICGGNKAFSVEKF